jgi:hypothetical protein
LLKQQIKTRYQQTESSKGEVSIEYASEITADGENEKIPKCNKVG